jgi:hypothetical protein
MTTYLAFNEVEGLDSITGDVTGYSGSGNRACIAGVNRASIAVGGEGFAIARWTPLTEGWVHFVLGANDLNSGSPVFIRDMWKLRDVNNSELVRIDTQATTTTMKYWTPVGSGTFGASAGSGYSNQAFDIFYKIHATEGRVDIFRNGALVASHTGDTQPSAATTFDHMLLQQPDALADTYDIYYSNILVSDLPTINAQVYTLPAVAGTVNTFETGTVLDIDEVGASDADFVSTTTDGTEIAVDTSVTLPALTAPSYWAGVTQVFRANYNAGAAVTNITPYLNSTAITSTTLGTQVALTVGPVGYHQVWEQDPSDSSAWDETKINNYEFGYRADT